MFVVPADTTSLSRHEIAETYDDKYDPYVKKRIAYSFI